jgi:hypothetical protein
MDVYTRLEKEKKDQREETWRDYVQRRNDLIDTYGSASGRRVLKRMMQDAFLFGPTIVNKPDAMTHVREGQRNLVLSILADVPGIAGQVLAEWCSEMESEILTRLQMETNDG